MRIRSWVMTAAMTAGLSVAMSAPSHAGAQGVFTSITIDVAALQAAAAENISRAAQNGIDPGTLALLAAGLGAVGIIRRRWESGSETPSGAEPA